MSRTFRLLFIALVLVTNVSCDQITKGIARKTLEYRQPINVVGEHLVLHRVENEGAFLSLGSEMPAPARFFVLALLPGAFLCFGMIWLSRQHTLSRISIAGIACVLGGGIGNVIDRWMYGSVTDFLHMDFGIIRTGIFNMADVSIMIGIGVVLVDQFLRSKRI